MTNGKHFALPLLIGIVLISSRIFAGPSEGPAADCRLKIQMIWGTDEAKPEDKNLKEIDPKLAEKLRRVFKWKNYFEVTNQNVALPSQMSKTISMSPKCKIELKRVEVEAKKNDEAIIVKLYGEGKLRTTNKIPIKLLQQGEYSILAGDDKDKQEDAWFVVLSRPIPTK